MASSENKWKKFWRILTWCLLIAFLLVCGTPFLSGNYFWFASLLGIAFPFLFVLMIIWLIVFIIKKKWKWVIAFAVALLLSLPQVKAVFGFGTNKEFVYEEKGNSIRVLSWNVSHWGESRATMGKDGVPGPHDLMMDFIKWQNADVLCLQEFFECYDTTLFKKNVPIVTKMGYPYHYFFPTIKIYENNFQYGIAIFSKYPIVDSNHYVSQGTIRSEGLSSADIVINNQRYRFFAGHLESVGLSTEDYSGPGESDINSSKVGSIIKQYGYRGEQAEDIQRIIKQSPYPSIFCCNLDDVPNSYAYFTVKGNLNDVFLEKGFGFGRTFRFILPTLRIDYMFADKRFAVKQFTVADPEYSDHYPLVADLQLK